MDTQHENRVKGSPRRRYVEPTSLETDGDDDNNERKEKGQEATETTREL
jgi:hypothetical protein